MMYAYKQWRSQGLLGSTHPEPQIEEENEEKLRKDRENLGEWGKIEEMLLSCPPGVESLTLATPLHTNPMNDSVGVKI